MSDTKVATKEDIKDLKADSKSIRTEILRVEVKVENLEDEVKEFRAENKADKLELHTKLDKLQNTLDKFVGRVDDLSVDNEVGTHHTRELELKVVDLVKRVKRIESSKQAS